MPAQGKPASGGPHPLPQPQAFCDKLFHGGGVTPGEGKRKLDETPMGQVGHPPLLSALAWPVPTTSSALGRVEVEPAMENCSPQAASAARARGFMSTAVRPCMWLRPATCQARRGCCSRLSMKQRGGSMCKWEPMPGLKSSSPVEGYTWPRPPRSQSLSSPRNLPT